MKNIGNNYSWQGMLIATILMFVGIFMLFSTDLSIINNFDNLIVYFKNYGDLFIFSIFFILVGLYCWFLYIRNRLIKPKNEILYLLNIEDNICCFINEKGKKYYCFNKNYVTNKYYQVLKTGDKIDEVINITYESFELPKTKDSYWLNFYSPIGNFENIFLLPIAYIPLLIGILSFNWYGLFLIVPATYIIIYDAIYKIKKRNNNFDDSKLINSYSIFINIIKILPILFINVLIFCLFIKGATIIDKLIISPFLLCAICSLGLVTAQILNNDKLVEIFKKSYIIIFLIFWFGVILFWTYLVIKDKQYSLILFTIPFWLAGIYCIYKFFIKRN